ncbi:MAG: serine protease [Thermodesulfobacteriota bacterium]|nr:serine protease [Thermodesulfobacteriota bacterium]
MNLKNIFIAIALSILYIAMPQNGLAKDTDKGIFPSRENKLVMQIKKIKIGVVAVGTYYFKDRPKLQFRGTGFAVGDGTVIVTTAHAISSLEEKNELNRLRIFHPQLHPTGIKASLLRKDEAHDLALLKVEDGQLPCLKLADSGNVQEGEAVAFTGYPLGFILGLNPTTHAGIISAIAPIVLPSPSGRLLKKQIVKFLRESYDIYQIDATAYPGNSGSPVFRVSTGEVIGITNMVFVKGKKEHLITKPSGITYAIPSNFARDLIKDLNQ